MTIVTDNSWYAELLLCSIARHAAFQQVPGLRNEEVQLVQSRSGIDLLSGKPGTWCGHTAGASSYFDRLWKTGLSTHSSANVRFVLHVHVSDGTGCSTGRRKREKKSHTQTT